MKRWLLASAVVIALSSGGARAATCTLPYTLLNGQTADGGQVMANFNAVLSCALASGNYLTPQQFGTIGVGNDTAVIQATINATPSGGAVYLGDTNYQVTGNGSEVFLFKHPIQFFCASLTLSVQSSPSVASRSSSA